MKANLIFLLFIISVTKFCYASKDNEFDNGTKITSINLSESKTEDLAVLGKVWGFLKYYHPAVAKGKYNWDYELFRILPKIITANNQVERNKILFEWVSSFGKVQAGKEKKNKNEVKMNPDLAWIKNSNLGPAGSDLQSESNSLGFKIPNRANCLIYKNILAGNNTGNSQK